MLAAKGAIAHIPKPKNISNLKERKEQSQPVIHKEYDEKDQRKNSATAIFLTRHDSANISRKHRLLHKRLA